MPQFHWAARQAAATQHSAARRGFGLFEILQLSRNTRRREPFLIHDTNTLYDNSALTDRQTDSRVTLFQAPRGETDRYSPGNDGIAIETMIVSIHLYMLNTETLLLVRCLIKYSQELLGERVI